MEDIFRVSTMTKHTTRDEIWHAVLTLVEERSDVSGFQARFEKDDVRERLDSDPSDRTLRDALNTMVELGHIEEAWGRGKFEPPE